MQLSESQLLWMAVITVPSGGTRKRQENANEHLQMVRLVFCAIKQVLGLMR